MIGAVLRLYVHYLVVSDLAVLLINGFSLQKICQLTAMQLIGHYNKLSE